MKKIILLVLMVFPLSAARAYTVSELQGKIQEADKNLKSIKFEYSQEMKSAESSKSSTVIGKAFFVKPNRLRVELESPEKQLIVTSGKFLYVYTPRFNQVLKDSWKHWARSNFFFPGLFGSSGSFEMLKNSYQWSLGQSNDPSTIKLTLVGKSSGQAESVDLWLGKDDFIPRRAELKNGGVSLITVLASLQLNPELNPSLFKFSAPKGASIVDVP